MRIDKATTADIPQLLNLLNSAYRGEEAKKGWTNEASLLEGDARTDETELGKLMNDPKSVILVMRDDNNIIGSVHLQHHHNNDLYLGLLSVSPLMQAKGLGKQLLAGAEKYASEMKCRKIYMTVISIRTELLEWYKRHGYRENGISKPLVVPPGHGRPVKPLILLELEKMITPPGKISADKDLHVENGR